MDQQQNMLRIVMSEQNQRKKTLKTNQTPTLPLRKEKPLALGSILSKVNEREKNDTFQDKF